MSHRLQGKVAVITGASKGLGAAIARHFGAEGAVVVNYSSSQEAAERVVSDIIEGGGRAAAVKANMRESAEVERLFAEAHRAYGRVDVLVNNAGVEDHPRAQLVHGHPGRGRRASPGSRQTSLRRSIRMKGVTRWLPIALLLAPIAITPSAPAFAQSATAPDRVARNKTVIGDAYERWAAGGTTFFDDVLVPDMTWTIVGSGLGAGTYSGRDLFKRDVLAPFAALLATPIRPVVQNLWADGDHVIVRWRGSATTRAGKPYRNDYVWIFRMRDGRADQVTAFLDLPAYQAVFRDR